ncbi:MAG: alpha-glucosidase C-terminal domain-containing protein [Muribaculaceae bacterium]|nr:alpha-glucosidase C-terminal domain-containing protein [Muribaculaceae bacterium]
MKYFNKIATYMAGMAFVLGSCTSYEIDMPENPEPPTIGNEVSTNVIYQANPRFFGENNCLQGVTAQIPRISGMGCNILWVMPIFEQGELNSIGSPYCIKNFKGINSKYGSEADFTALVQAAHGQGMKVILDWVANHTSWDHPWITQYPDRYQKDGNGNIVSPSGWSDVAQLDFENPATREAMEDAMTYWVTQFGIDGFRCDFVDGVPHSFWSQVISDLQASNPDIIMLAETAKSEYYADGFTMIYDWNCPTAISGAFKGGKPSEVIKEAQDALAQVPDGKAIMRYVFNHDVASENNVATMYGKWDAVPAAYVLASMLNGTPMIYSSMDVENMSGKLSFFDYRTLSFSSALSEKYAAINNAFKTSAEVRRGELQDFSNSSVACFMRSIPDHNLLVAVNTTDSPQTVKTPIVMAGASATDVLNNTQITLPVSLDLEPYSYTIIMQ